MNVAHYLVQGTDVWLNNPRRPAEASGTSGMKAAVNGVLNISVLDGWWCEGYNGENGWKIGSGEEYADNDYQDEIESKAIFDILEKDVIPTFYDRGNDGLPREWIRIMKTSMQSICPAFNTNRMIEEYTRRSYRHAMEDNEKLVQQGFEYSKKIVAWQKALYKNWDGIKILQTEDSLSDDVSLGKSFNVRSKIKLGQISPDKISVQLYFGYLDSKRRMSDPVVSVMRMVDSGQDGVYTFEGMVSGDRVGHCGYVVRVLPQYDGNVVYLPGLITWQ